MQVGLIKVLREPASSISPCRRTKLCTFFEQAGLALCCEPRKVVRDMPVGLLAAQTSQFRGDDDEFGNQKNEHMAASTACQPCHG